MGSGEAMVGLTASLAVSHTVIAPDLVGHGRSPAPAAVDDYHATAQVEQLRGLVRDLGFARVSVVGYSMGARLALTLANAAPALVDRLALIGGSPGLADPDLVSERIRADAALARQLEREGVEAFVGYWEGLALFESQKRLAPEVRAQVRATRLQQRALGLANSLRGFGTGSMPPLWDALSELRMPTVAIAGALDSKYITIANEIAKLMPTASAAAVADVGHATHVEDPDSTAALVLGHFAP